MNCTTKNKIKRRRWKQVFKTGCGGEIIFFPFAYQRLALPPSNPQRSIWQIQLAWHELYGFARAPRPGSWQGAGTDGHQGWGPGRHTQGSGVEVLRSACDPAPAGRPSSLTGLAALILPNPLDYHFFSSAFQTQDRLCSRATFPSFDSLWPFCPTAICYSEIQLGLFVYVFFRLRER